MPSPKPVPMVLVQNDEYWLPFALNAIAGKFDRYVIYDVGSTDKTPEIIDWFMDHARGNADIFHRKLPDCPPIVQGCFRNSMLAETRAEWAFMVDADEVYARADVGFVAGLGSKLHEAAEDGKLYGVVRRREFSHDLRFSFSAERTHHRLYHRTAIFHGHHPGEAPVVVQNHRNEVHFPYVTCFHFHNTERSSLGDDATHGRSRRKSQHTYRPGEQLPVDLLASLPDLRHELGWEVAPALASLRAEYAN